MPARTPPVPREAALERLVEEVADDLRVELPPERDEGRAVRRRGTGVVDDHRVALPERRGDLLALAPPLVVAVPQESLLTWRCVPAKRVR